MTLPQMVSSSTMDMESVGLVRDYVNELLMCDKYRQTIYGLAN